MNVQPNVNLWADWSWNDSESEDVKPLYIANTKKVSMEEHELTPNMKVFFDKLLKIKDDLLELSKENNEVEKIYNDLNNLIKETK